jgi:hypothetical protein
MLLAAGRRLLKYSGLPAGGVRFISGRESPQMAFLNPVSDAPTDRRSGDVARRSLVTNLRAVAF